MQYGICHLSLIPVRINTDQSAELVTQLLYGEHFKVLERRKAHSKIRNAYDDSEGWADNNQFTVIGENEFRKIESTKSKKYASDLVSFIETEQKTLMPLMLGSSIGPEKFLKHRFEGSFARTPANKTQIVRNRPSVPARALPLGGKNPIWHRCTRFCSNGLQNQWISIVAAW